MTTRTMTIEQTIEIPKGVYTFKHQKNGEIYCLYKDAETGKRHGLGRLDGKLSARLASLIDRLKAGTMLDRGARLVKPVTYAEGTLGFYIEQFLGHREYAKTADNTKTNYRPMCEFLKFWFGHIAMKNFNEDHLRRLQTAVEKGEPPVSADEAAKMGPGPLLSGTSSADRVVGMFGRVWNFALKYLKFKPRCENPAKLVDPIHEGENHPRWPEHVIRRYLDGATDREALAMLLLLYTGQRITDCCNMLKTAFDGTHILVKKQGKTGVRVRILVLKPLRAILERLGIEAGADGYIATNAHGRKYNRRTMLNVIAKRLAAIGEPGYCPHGLRASAASRIYQATHSIELVKAVTGHKDDAVVWRYIQEIEQELHADKAMLAVEAWEESNVVPISRKAA